MRHRRLPRQVRLLLVAVLITGCLPPQRELKYLGHAELQHYVDEASKIDYPTVDVPTDTIGYAQEPRRIRKQLNDFEIWDVSLDETIKLALERSKIIRDAGSFLSPGNALLQNPSLAPSVYDPAIQATGVLFGQRGVEAALADFDAQFTVALHSGRSEQPLEAQNNAFGRRGDSSVDEAGDFRSRLQKIMADGSQFSLQHNWSYSGANIFDPGFRRFPSHFTASPTAGINQGTPGFGLQYRRPLLAAAGVEFNRIAGPNATAINGVSGVAQGVLIARINNDISVADFQQSVAILTRDVRNAYWDLWLAYQFFEVERNAENVALQLWQLTQALKSPADEQAQALSTYWEVRQRAHTAHSSLFESEARLRRLLSLPTNDGKMLRPSDEPTTAEFLPDWEGCLFEALAQRPELRKQKWAIKSEELQLKAARSLTRPRLDFVSRYEINGFGDRLFSTQETDQEYRSFYETLTQGDHTGWGLGFEFAMPIGFRAAHAQVQNHEWRLAKARTVLAEQEREIAHELGNAFQAIDRTYVGAKDNYNRRLAALDLVKTSEIAYQTGRGGGQRTVTIDLLLRSQLSLAPAQSAYFQSVVQYNQAITDLQYRKGTILADHNIFLAEGDWDPMAYRDSLRRAWERSHGIDAKFKHTEPPEFTRSGEFQFSPMLSADAVTLPPVQSPKTPVPAQTPSEPETAPEDAAPTPTPQPEPDPFTPDLRAQNWRPTGTVHQTAGAGRAVDSAAQNAPRPVLAVVPQLPVPADRGHAAPAPPPGTGAVSGAATAAPQAMKSDSTAAAGGTWKPTKRK